MSNSCSQLTNDEVNNLPGLRYVAASSVPQEPAYEDFVRLAQALCGTPISLIHFVDREQQEFLYCYGLTASETTAREAGAFFRETLLAPGEVVLVKDTHHDPRFVATPLVSGPAKVRFYAGVPLITKDGVVRGVLCVMDCVPRELTPSQQECLQTLANHVLTHLSLSLSLDSQGALLRDLSIALLNAQVAEDRFQMAVAAMHDGLIVQEQDQGIVLCNPRAEQLLGLLPGQLLGQMLNDPRWRAIRDDGRPFPDQEHPVRITLEEGSPQENCILGLHKPDDDLLWVSMNSTPLFRNNESQPYATVVTFADITDRRHFEKIAEQQLIEFNRLNRQLELRQRELAQANSLLEAQAMIDGLTGLKNHRKFQEELQNHYQISIRYQKPLSLIILDVDSFKSYNDTFGHPAGDEVLRMIANTLLNATRISDSAARYGGEEFAIILPHTNSEASRLVAERLRSTIAEIPWPRRSVTISVGVATLSLSTADVRELIVEADQALYHSKNNGKNRITHSFDIAPEPLQTTT